MQGRVGSVSWRGRGVLGARVTGPASRRQWAGGVFLTVLVLVLVSGATCARVPDTEALVVREGGLVELIYFYLVGCPACLHAEELLQELAEEYPQLQVHKYNLTSAAGRELVNTLREVYELEGISIPAPTMFVGDVAVVGRTLYGLEENPLTLLGPAWVQGIEEAVEQAVARAQHFVLRFCDQEIGYCMGYPVDWAFTVHGDGSVVFSGAEQTEASAAVVWTQRFPLAALGGEDSTRRLIDRYKYGLVEVSPYVWIDSRGFPNGDGFVAEYVLSGGTYRQWRVAIAHGEELHSWAYIAPAELFNTHLPVAGAMLATWGVFGVE